MRASFGPLLSGFMVGLCAANLLYAEETATPAAPPGGPVQPVPAVAPALAVAAPRPAAPAGTLYLAAPVSVRTANGIIGFEPGQTVRLVRTDAKTGRLFVTDGKYQVEVLPTQVTTNSGTATALQQQENANRRAAKASQDAMLLAQKQHEAALKRVEINRDVEMAKSIRPPPRSDRDISNERWNPHLFDRPYELRGNPYTPGHAVIPRWQGPHQKPGTLRFESNGLGFY